MSIPVVLTSAGRTNQTPAALRAQLVALVAATNPGYTSELPGSLIEDVASTDTGSLVLIDQFVTELINSLTPYGANAFILAELGAIYGVQIGANVNTSVYVTFTGTVGFVISPGFTVSDGTYQYIVQDGGIIGSGGTSSPLYAVATTAGTWAVPVGTVTQLVTSVPGAITLSVTNLSTGTPSSGAETEESYRARVLQAGLAASTGMATYLKTLLSNVSGVQPRLVAVQQQSTGGWEVIVGGGDPYEVANAIWRAIFDISTLVGSSMNVTGITKANPGVVTTDKNHNYTTGQTIQMNGVVGMTTVNGVNYTATVISPTTFSIGVNTSGYTTYVSGGVVTPNARNITVNIKDSPDTYTIPFVNPPQQTVSMVVTWNTIATNVVSPAAVSQLAIPALVDYVNSVYVGQPINLFELQATFQQAVAHIIPTALLTRMVFTVSINGIVTAPLAGTGEIIGDPESFFETNTSLITVSQG